MKNKLAKNGIKEVKSNIRKEIVKIVGENIFFKKLINFSFFKN